MVISIIVGLLLLCLLVKGAEALVNAIDTEEDRVGELYAPVVITGGTLEDVQWVQGMLKLAGSDKKILVPCACGYAAECMIHCNHELKDCPGDPWNQAAIV